MRTTIVYVYVGASDPGAINGQSSNQSVNLSFTMYERTNDNSHNTIECTWVCQGWCGGWTGGPGFFGLRSDRRPQTISVADSPLFSVASFLPNCTTRLVIAVALWRPLVFTFSPPSRRDAQFRRCDGCCRTQPLGCFPARLCMGTLAAVAGSPALGGLRAGRRGGGQR